MVKKTCTKCGGFKPLTEYHKNKKSKDGLQYYCKTCCNKASKEFRELNPKYYSYKGDGYFADKQKWEYIRKWGAADKTIKIYAIEVPSGEIYVGCTKAFMKRRMLTHIGDYRRYKRGFKSRIIPKLFDVFDTMEEEEIVKILKSAYILQEDDGSRTKMYSMERKWIDRLREQGYTLLNSKR